MKSKRRSAIKRLLASLAAVGGAASLSGPTAQASSIKKVSGVHRDAQEKPLYSSSVVHNGLVYLSGIGAHFEGDIKAHTEHVLSEMEKELNKADSSMEKVLKVNVYLHDLRDYQAMNEVYRGRFGANPPVRTTIAAFGGIPGDSLVEIDCIASL